MFHNFFGFHTGTDVVSIPDVAPGHWVTGVRTFDTTTLPRIVRHRSLINDAPYPYELKPQQFLNFLSYPRTRKLWKNKNKYFSVLIPTRRVVTFNMHKRFLGQFKKNNTYRL